MSAFDAQDSADYDAQIVRMVPGYEVLHRLVGVCLGQDLAAEARVLIVGAGTGTELIELAQAHPQWRFTAVEPAPAMASLAIRKLETLGLSDRVTWHQGPLENLADEEPFDAATLLLVLHFLPNNGEKLELLTEISNRLTPGAPFLIASYIGDPETTRTRKLYELNRSWAVSHGVDAQVVAQNINLDRKDVYLVPEERVKSLLRDCGFIDVQRIYQALSMIAWFARTQR